MIDAYTIGITLALQDGVSDGIVAIRRDLAELDIAVAESAARLLMLRKLAADLAVPMPPDQSAKQSALFAPPTFRPEPVLSPIKMADMPSVVPAVTPPPDTVLPAQTPAPTARVLDAAARAPTPITTSGSPSANPLPTLPIVSTTPAPAAPPPAALPAAQSGSIAPTAVPAFPALVVQQVAPQHLPPSIVPPAKPDKSPDFAVIARSLASPTSTQVPRKPDRHAPALSEPTPPLLTTAYPPQPPIVSPPKATAPAPVPQFPSPRPSPTSSTLQSSTPNHFEAQKQAAAPSPATPQRVVPPSPVAPPAERQSVAPTAPSRYSTPFPAVRPTEPALPSSAAVSPDRQQANGPAYAELHLDGAAIGRWVTRHMERQVTRPQAGATGFDPRMSPTWAGAPIGN